MVEKEKQTIRLLTVKDQFDIEAATETKRADGSVTVDYRKRQLLLLAKATGKTEADIEALPLPEFKDLMERFAEQHMSGSERINFQKAQKRLASL